MYYVLHNSYTDEVYCVSSSNPMEGLEALGENTKLQFITLHRSLLHTRTELHTIVPQKKIGLQTACALNSGFASQSWAC